MGDARDALRRVENLRRWRNAPAKDLSLSQLPATVKKQYVKPHKSLSDIAEIWDANIPPALLDRTMLVSLSRGVLLVHVADSATLYEVDQLLRSGLEMRLRQASKITLKKVRTQVAGDLA